MRLLTSLILASLPGVAMAQAVVTSPAADSVKVSIYRDPHRGSGAIDARWPDGFALITETRTIAVPGGDAVIRFEGVADSILSESAIVTGLPGGVEQKNRDALVLSPAALIEFALGKRVHIRRTNMATGKVREEEAIVRAGPNRGVVIETAAGIEALRCSGLPEALVFDEVPEGLSDRPVLSVTTQSDQPVTATVTLSYLAGGFDWGADYIARLSPDGRTMDLFAWATLANGTGQSLAQADTSTIAGRLNRTTRHSSPTPPAPWLQLGCWPTGTTSDIPEEMPPAPFTLPPPPPPPAPPAVAMAAPAERIVVTGSAIMAEQEDLADLKLYRIPEPVTVAAKSQKQVAMVDRSSIPVEQIVSFDVAMASAGPPSAGQRVIKTRNDVENHLGLPLPAGTVRIFTIGDTRTMLTGRAELRDLAIGEDVELRTGTASDIQLTSMITEEIGFGAFRMRTRIANATAAAQSVEVIYWPDDGFTRLRSPSQRLEQRNGRPLWKVTVPANGEATLDYRVDRDR